MHCAAVSRATQALLTAQREDGHFVFELEADVSIPAEFILFKHYLGEPADAGLEAKIAAFIRRQQAAHDGWPLFTDGAFNISSSVKAYFALKTVGDSPEADHMRRARAAILAHGGAAKANVFTRALLLARRAGHAGRDLTFAGLVSFPRDQNLLLEPRPSHSADGCE